MINLDLQGRVRRFTARTRVYTLAILGVVVGGVYLSLALFLELSDRLGAVPAALITGAVVIVLGGLPWLMMSIRSLPDPAPRPGDTGDSNDSPLLQAEQMGERAGQQVNEMFQRNALAGVGVALALGAVAGYSPRARKAVRDMIDVAIREQSKRR